MSAGYLTYFCLLLLLQQVSWHEVGRPQVHGYDLSCITTLGKYKFASGAEEKVIRGFTAPANFIRNFGQICGFEIEEDLGKILSIIIGLYSFYISH